MDSGNNIFEVSFRCLVSYDHISQRIQKLATARAILGNLLADLKAQTS